MQTFIPKTVNEFSTGIGLVDARVPVIATSSIQIAARTTSPDNVAARAAAFYPDAWERKWDVPF